MRRTLAALEVSVVILKAPISAVARTCVPPHSSRDHWPSPTSTIRTTSPYFSPNRAIAPRLRASSSVVVSARTGWLASTHSLTRSSTARTSSTDSGAPWVKSKRSLSGPDVGAGLAHVAAEPLAQRGVQQVGGGVVALGGAARAAVDLRHHALVRLVISPSIGSSTSTWSSSSRSTSLTRAEQPPPSQRTTPSSWTWPPPVA